jgi:hypothetical protein
MSPAKQSPGARDARAREGCDLLARLISSHPTSPATEFQTHQPSTWLRELPPKTYEPLDTEFEPLEMPAQLRTALRRPMLEGTA